MEIRRNFLEQLKKENRLRANYLSQEHQNEVREVECYLNGKFISQLETQKFIRECITRFLKSENEIDDHIEIMSLNDAKQFVENAGGKKWTEQLITLLYRVGIALMLAFLAGVFSEHGSFVRYTITLSDILLTVAFLLSSYLFRDYWQGAVAMHKGILNYSAYVTTSTVFLIIYFRLKKYTDLIVLANISTWIVFGVVLLACAMGRIAWNCYWNQFSEKFE